MKRARFILFAAAGLALAACQTYRDAEGGLYRSRREYEQAMATNARARATEDRLNAMLAATTGGHATWTGVLCRIDMTDEMVRGLTPLDLQRVGALVERWLNLGVTNPVMRARVVWYYAGYPYYETP